MKPLQEWLDSADVQKQKQESQGERFSKTFFRDPQRPIYINHDVFLSPADGVILYALDRVKPDEPIVEIKGKKFTPRDALDDKDYNHDSLVIGVFMCYDDQTEVYTTDGWQYFKDVQPHQMALTRRPDGLAEWSRIKSKFIFPYSGELYSIKCNGIDLVVTPNHKIPMLSKWSRSKYVFPTIEEIATWDARKADNYHIPKSFTWQGMDVSKFRLPGIFIENYKRFSVDIEIDMGDWMEFLGWWLSEGCLSGYRVIISQKKPININKIRALLKRLPFNFYTDKSKSGVVNFIIDSKQLSTCLKSLGTRCQHKHVPDYAKMLSRKYLLRIWKSLMAGDGHIGKVKQYISTSKQLADDVQDISYKLGFNAEVYQRKYRPRGSILGVRVKSQLPAYVVCIGKRGFKIAGNILRRKYLKKIPYSGFVYDIEAEKNHVIWVRRNGKCIWSSNSEFDVHINRVPTSGYLSKVHRTPYLFTPNISMMLEQEDLTDHGGPKPDDMGYLFPNERCINSIHAPKAGCTYYVIQIAERDVDEILNWDYEHYVQGERFGLVRFGSQVDLILPLNGANRYELMVEKNVHVEGGVDPLIKIIR